MLRAKTATAYEPVESEPTGIQPQLLNAVEETEVQRLLNDDHWCAQEKHDGRRLIIRKKGQDIIGINKGASRLP
jgi:bifunctional non-homologous end joining protein LigD